jgi:putative PEP-CTERM system histidine kinase
LDSFSGIAFGLAALAYGVLGLYLLQQQGRAGHERSAAGSWLTAAVATTALWALAALAASIASGGIGLFAGAAAAALDVLRYALWFGFALLLLRPGPARAAWRADTLPALLAWIALAVASAGWLWVALRGAAASSGSNRAAIVGLLALAVAGLLLVEQLFRNIGEDSRWNAKPLCLGLVCAMAFDVYLFSEGLLFGGLDGATASARGAAHALAVPLLFITARRRSDWAARLQVSRSAAFHSATLVLAGVYLLFMAAIGYYVRWFGGSWGPALQVSLLFLGLAFGVALIVSGSLRSWLRVFVGKHFFSYRYDYRDEWLRFTARLSSSQGSPQEVGTSIVRGLADMVECPAGMLWTRTGAETPFAPVARWNMPAAEDGATSEAAESAFSRYLMDPGWVIDLDEYRHRPAAYGQLVLPTWLLARPDAWLVVPLQSGNELLGFVVLARPRTEIALNWEVRDLLKTASRQAAGYLAQMQAAEALLEARKFDAFNRMSAFVVHDLKNIVTQLSLMLKNAQRHHANPEFQQDMLLTVESSLEKMRRLMLQLREGAAPPGGSRGVELAPIVRRLAGLAEAQGRHLQTDLKERLATRGHEERLERVLGHLVQNAFDATPREGRVWIQVQRYSGQVEVEVGDTGVGMNDEFVQTRLFRPFNTTKKTGMGIGSFESMQYVRELGGSIAVHSEPGVGTRVTVLLPLFDIGNTSDLMPLSPH